MMKMFLPIQINLIQNDLLILHWWKTNIRLSLLFHFQQDHEIVLVSEKYSTRKTIIIYWNRSTICWFGRESNTINNISSIFVSFYSNYRSITSFYGCHPTASCSYSNVHWTTLIMSIKKLYTDVISKNHTIALHLIFVQTSHRITKPHVDFISTGHIYLQFD